MNAHNTPHGGPPDDGNSRGPVGRASDPSKGDLRRETKEEPQFTGIDLLARLEGVRQTGPNRWMARCPVHEDRTASLSIRDDGEKWLLYCFALCEPESILQSLG